MGRMLKRWLSRVFGINRTKYVLFSDVATGNVGWATQRSFRTGAHGPGLHVVLEFEASGPDEAFEVLRDWRRCGR